MKILAKGASPVLIDGTFKAVEFKAKQAIELSIVARPERLIGQPLPTQGPLIFLGGAPHMSMSYCLNR
ncbi:MAG: hypothetical protein ACXIUO_06055 [Erythrobacter sp.]